MYLVLTASVFAKYNLDNGKVIYIGYDNKNGKWISIEKEIEGIDYNSFIKINDFYVLDKNYVYYRGEKTDIDRNSFQVLRLDMALDKDYVYHGSMNLGIDSKTFSFFSFETPDTPIPEVRRGWWFYIKDKDKAYFVITKDGEVEKKVELKDVNVNKLEYLNHMTVKDDKHVYYRGKIIPEIDAESYRANLFGYSKDKNNYYYHENGIKKVEGADYKTFKPMKKDRYKYAKDKYNIFFHEIIIKGADLDTFEILPVNFSKDKNGYFYKEQRLEGVTFEDIQPFLKKWNDDELIPGYKTKEKEINFDEQ